MNLASWIILAIVVGIVGLAARATFSKKKGGCCGCSHDAPPAKPDEPIDIGVTLGCGNCAACKESGNFCNMS